MPCASVEMGGMADVYVLPGPSSEGPGHPFAVPSAGSGGYLLVAYSGSLAYARSHCVASERPLSSAVDGADCLGPFHFRYLVLPTS